MDTPHPASTVQISFVPELLPDELLYSFIGRMGVVNALGNTRERMRLLFGGENLIPVVDLPTRLSYLQMVLGRLSPWNSALEIIDSATIYPYHRPFLTRERHAAIENILLGTSGKSLKTLLGRVANRFGAAPALRFCPLCITADTHRYGIPYWHCAHQLPGVTACKLHGASLVEYSKRFQRTDRQRIILAPGTFAAALQTAASSRQQVAFASLSNELLTARLPVLGVTTYQNIYRDAAFRLGLNRKHYVDYPGLATAVRAHYCDFEGFPHRDRLLSTQRNPLSWLRALIERPERSSHPICHLLMIGFLFKTVEAFQRMVANPSVQVCNPISSRAPRCDSSIPPLQNDQLLHDTGLSCREVARLTNRSVTTIVTQRRTLGLAISERPKNRRPDMIAQIGSMLEKGAAPRQIAVDCAASLSTIYRLRAQAPQAAQRVADRRFEEEREKRRQVWEELLAKSGRMGCTAIRKKSAATYAWLYRNDREWLQEKSTDFRISRVPLARVDWSARDLELCAMVRIFVTNVRGQVGRPRISRTLMTQHIGDASVRANLERLPKLKTVMDELEEARLAYQCERIRLAILTLVKMGEPVANWRIQRMAGVRTWTEAHNECVNSILTNMDRQFNL